MGSSRRPTSACEQGTGKICPLLPHAVAADRHMTRYGMLCRSLLSHARECGSRGVWGRRVGCAVVGDVPTHPTPCAAGSVLAHQPRRAASNVDDNATLLPEGCVTAQCGDGVVNGGRRVWSHCGLSIFLPVSTPPHHDPRCLPCLAMGWLAPCK